MSSFGRWTQNAFYLGNVRVSNMSSESGADCALPISLVILNGPKRLRSSLFI